MLKTIAYTGNDFIKKREMEIISSCESMSVIKTYKMLSSKNKTKKLGYNLQHLCIFSLTITR